MQKNYWKFMEKSWNLIYGGQISESNNIFWEKIASNLEVLKWTNQTAQLAYH